MKETRIRQMMACLVDLDVLEVDDNERFSVTDDFELLLRGHLAHILKKHEYKNEGQPLTEALYLNLSDYGFLSGPPKTEREVLDAIKVILTFVNEDKLRQLRRLCCSGKEKHE